MIERKIMEKEGARRAAEMPSYLEKKKESLVPPVSVKDPEVSEKAVRRKFPARQKLRILKLADACTESGSLGALLRREGLYASNLKTWRRQQEEGALSALAQKNEVGRRRFEMSFSPKSINSRKKMRSLKIVSGEQKQSSTFKKKSLRSCLCPWSLKRKEAAIDGSSHTPFP